MNIMSFLSVICESITENPHIPGKENRPVCTWGHSLGLTGKGLPCQPLGSLGKAWSGQKVPPLQEVTGDRGWGHRGTGSYEKPPAESCGWGPQLLRNGPNHLLPPARTALLHAARFINRND